MVSINGLYDKYMDPHWSNPSNTHIRVFEIKKEITVMVGRFTHHYKEVIEIENGAFITPEIGEWLEKHLPKGKKISITEDYSDDCCWVGYKDEFYKLSYHSFWDRAELFYLRKNNIIKWYWTDGAQGGLLKNKL